MADLGSHDDQVSASADNGDKPQEKKLPVASTPAVPNSADALKKALQPDQKRKKRRRRRRRKTPAESQSALPDSAKKRPEAKPPLKPKKQDTRFQPMESDEPEEVSEPPEVPSFPEVQEISPPDMAPPTEPMAPESETVPPSPEPVEAETPIASVPEQDQAQSTPPPSLEPESGPPSLPDLEIQPDSSIPEPSLPQPDSSALPSEPVPEPDSIAQDLPPQPQDQPSSEISSGIDYQYQYQYSDKPSVYEIGQDQSLYPSDQPDRPQEIPSTPQETQPAESNDIPIDTQETGSLDQNQGPDQSESFPPSPQEVLADEQKEQFQRETTTQQAQKLADEIMQKQSTPQKEKGDGFFKVLQKFSGGLASILKKIFGGIAFLFRLIGRFFGKIGSFFGGILSLRRIAVAFFMLLVLAGAYLIYVNKLPQKAYFYIADLVTPKPPPKIEVHVDEGTLNQIGISSVLLFAHHYGSVFDIIPPHIATVDFFGYLLEPRVQGETGISGITYYGELRDLAQNINEFVVYLQNLEKLQALYQIDVYKMLDQSTQRDVVLLQYLEDLQKAKTKSIQLFQQMGINVDDLRASYESLNPEKVRYETDFFSALEALQSEKSDALLKGFIDITQKQAALKARINALTKVMAYYQVALEHLDRRIEAVEKNKEALIQGIRVIDVPGSGVNIIIRP